MSQAYPCTQDWKQPQLPDTQPGPGWLWGEDSRVKALDSRLAAQAALLSLWHAERKASEPWGPAWGPNVPEAWDVCRDRTATAALRLAQHPHRSIR